MTIGQAFIHCHVPGWRIRFAYILARARMHVLCDAWVSHCIDLALRKAGYSK